MARSAGRHCGSPTAPGDRAPGDRLLDLGYGAGFDCLAAARDVGRGGRVVGIDMTPEMLHPAHRQSSHR